MPILIMTFFSETHLPLDLDDEDIENLVNKQGSFMSITDQFNGFSVEDYFKTFWSFEIGKVDREFFWFKYPSRYHRGVLDNSATYRAAIEALLDHMLTSFVNEPDKIAEFFNMMLFLKLDLKDELVKMNAEGKFVALDPQDKLSELDPEEVCFTPIRTTNSLCSATEYLYFKRPDMYQDYFRPSLYKILEDDELGTLAAKNWAMGILAWRKKEVQAYPLFKRLIAHPYLWDSAKASLRPLNRNHPDYVNLNLKL